MVTLEMSPCTNVTLTFNFDNGLDHLVHGGYGWGSPTPGYEPHWRPCTNTNWSTDRRSQCDLKLSLRYCTANYRPVLSSERAPYMRNKESNSHSNKCNIWSLAPKGARHQHELADWPSVIMWLRLQLWFSLLANCKRLSSLENFSTLKKEAIRSSEMSVRTRPTLRHILKDGILYSNRLEKLKSHIYKFNNWALVEKLLVVDLFKTSRHFMWPEIFLPCSQEPPAGSYSKPAQSSPYHPIPYIWFILILSTGLCIGISNCLISSHSSTNILYSSLFSPFRATCTTHLIPGHLVILIIFGEVNKLWRSSSSKLDPKICWNCVPILN
jgi:hypothetical protein